MDSKEITPQISLVTTCKGRLADFKRCIHSWLNLKDANYEIVVVDYDCPEKVGDYVEQNCNGWIKDHPITAIKVVRVTKKKFFNLNDARNCGLTAVSAPIVMMIDSDVAIVKHDLLSWIFHKFDHGTLFIGNVAILPSSVEEGYLYYKYKYNIEVDFPILVPLMAEHLGLTGTVCISAEHARCCRGYDPLINRTGYGSDDLEFYLRYLNYYFYNHESPSDNLLDKCNELISYFPDLALETIDNSEEEKQKYYRKKLQDSMVYNIHYINKTISKLRKQYPQRMKIDPIQHSVVLHKPWPLKLDDNLPAWFPHLFYYWFSVVLTNRGILNEYRYIFPKEIFNNDFNELENGKRNRFRYRIGTIAYRLFENELAKQLFYKIIEDKTETSSHLLSGAHYYLAQIMLRHRKNTTARMHFSACLKLNPYNRQALSGLKSTDITYSDSKDVY